MRSGLHIKSQIRNSQGGGGNKTHVNPQLCPQVLGANVGKVLHQKKIIYYMLVVYTHGHMKPA